MAANSNRADEQAEWLAAFRAQLAELPPVEEERIALVARLLTVGHLRRTGRLPAKEER